MNNVPLRATALIKMHVRRTSPKINKPNKTDDDDDDKRESGGHKMQSFKNKMNHNNNIRNLFVCTEKKRVTKFPFTQNADCSHVNNERDAYVGCTTAHF